MFGGQVGRNLFLVETRNDLRIKCDFSESFERCAKYLTKICILRAQNRLSRFGEFLRNVWLFTKSRFFAVIMSINAMDLPFYKSFFSNLTNFMHSEHRRDGSYQQGPHFCLLCRREFIYDIAYNEFEAEKRVTRGSL